jgi:hypothetical protein
MIMTAPPRTYEIVWRGGVLLFICLLCQHEIAVAVFSPLKGSKRTQAAAAMKMQ